MGKKILVSVKDLSVGYPGNPLLIESINWELQESSLFTLLGENGSGKSSLFRVIAGLQKPVSGNVSSENELLDEVSYVSTRTVANQNMLSRQFLELGAFKRTNWLGRLNGDDLEELAAISQSLGLEQFFDKPIGMLSDGQMQRLRIAQALMKKSPVILFDEPTSFLDFKSREMILELLLNLSKNQSKCIVFSTHELDLASEYSMNHAIIRSKRLEFLKGERLTKNQLRERLS